MAENKEDRLQLLAELRGHTNRVWTVAWSPSGKYLASCGGDKTIRIWSKDASDDSKWVCTSVLDGVHTRTVRCVAWSPCGTKIASSGFDGQVGIWEYDTDDAEWQCIAALEGHQNEVKWVSWSNDGSLIATCSRDKTACIWEADASRDFDCVSWLHGHSQDVKYAMWSTFGENVLLTASYDNSIKVWTEEDDDWYCTETLSEHTSTVWQLAMDKEGKRLVSCSDDKSMIVWQKTPSGTGNGITASVASVEKEQEKAASKNKDSDSDSDSDDGDVGMSTGNRFHWVKKCVLKDDHERTIFSVDWSPVNDMIASAGADNIICVYDDCSNNHGNNDDTTDHKDSDKNVASSSSSSSSLSSTQYALSSKTQQAHSADVNCVRWNPKPSIMTTRSGDSVSFTTGNLLASASDDGVVKIWRYV